VLRYATGLWPRLATLVRGSSRRIMTMSAGVSSILEYQTDQPSMKPLRPLSLLLQPHLRANGPPHLSLAGSFHISEASPVRCGQRSSDRSI
jgi:hypothetical protein